MGDHPRRDRGTRREGDRRGVGAKFGGTEIVAEGARDADRTPHDREPDPGGHADKDRPGRVLQREAPLVDAHSAPPEVTTPSMTACWPMRVTAAIGVTASLDALGAGPEADGAGVGDGPAATMSDPLRR